MPFTICKHPDKPFEVGDSLLMIEHNGYTERYTERTLERWITCVASSFGFPGVSPGYAELGLAPGDHQRLSWRLTTNPLKNLNLRRPRAALGPLRILCHI
jgi:hypothetical protein